MIQILLIYITIPLKIEHFEMNIFLEKCFPNMFAKIPPSKKKLKKIPKISDFKKSREKTSLVTKVAELMLPPFISP